ncbi:phosphoesterase PA-phosphatase [Actinoplanes sp. NPDC049596]|uniref:phosphoesterase PA-phosphatase n=1 Tax=unclassified Actinoplanes TaxID=2626549 RepID=UPI003424D241
MASVEPETTSAHDGSPPRSGKNDGQLPAEPRGAASADRAARLITEVFSPGLLVAALLAVVVWHVADSLAEALTWGAIAIGAASLLPVLYILRGVRRGRWTDKHVIVHSQRRKPLLIILVSTATGIGALALAGAPRTLLMLIASMVLSLLVAVPVTLLFGWGVSIHALVAAGSVAALTVLHGWPVAAVGCVVVTAVGWARVRLKEHSLGQVVFGALVGALAMGVAFPLLA